MATLDRDPICPYCEATWTTEGPAVRDVKGQLRVVYCPGCLKVVAVLPAPAERSF